MNRKDNPWFAPKRYGYGASLPIAWQGWLLTLGYCALMIMLAIWATRSSGRQVVGPGAGMVVVTALFLILAARHTRGGWHWRWGEPD